MHAMQIINDLTGELYSAPCPIKRLYSPLSFCVYFLFILCVFVWVFLWLGFYEFVCVCHRAAS